MGEIREGYVADFNIMELSPCEEIVEDSIGDTITLKEKLILKKTIYCRGDESEVFVHNS